MLRGIDLDVAEHEVVCLIGASGSGKSTLLRCVNLLEPIDAGRIVVQGEEITARGVDVNRIRRGIGIVFQSYNLFPHMSVLENVTLAPRKALGLSRRDAATQATELLARFGLADKRDDYPERLSGGQQQRVAIVRALAMQPGVMLLDEVTSALDPELVAEVLRVIRELADGGMTMLIATHEMGFARDIAGRVCFLDAGVILEEGPPERIFTSPEQPRTRQFLDRIIEAGRLYVRKGGGKAASRGRKGKTPEVERQRPAYTSIVLENNTTRDVVLEPLDDWIVVEPLDDTETASGLIVPINEGAQTRQAIVAAVGPDVESIDPGRQGAVPARRRLRGPARALRAPCPRAQARGPARPHPRLAREEHPLSRMLLRCEEGAIRRMDRAPASSELVAPPPGATNLLDAILDDGLPLHAIPRRELTALLHLNEGSGGGAPRTMNRSSSSATWEAAAHRAESRKTASGAIPSAEPRSFARLETETPKACRPRAVRRDRVWTTLTT